MAGFSNLYAQTNAGALLGSDEEQDPALKTRCRLAKSQLSATGPWQKYASVVLDVRKDSNGDPVMPKDPGYAVMP